MTKKYFITAKILEAVIAIVVLFLWFMIGSWVTVWYFQFDIIGIESIILSLEWPITLFWAMCIYVSAIVGGALWVGLYEAFQDWINWNKRNLK